MMLLHYTGWGHSLTWLFSFLALLPFPVSTFTTTSFFSLLHKSHHHSELILQQTTNVFQECNTIACIEEQWVDARKLQLNATAVALKQTTQLFLAGQQEAITLLPQLVDALDQQIGKDREPYPVVGVTTSLISLSALMTSRLYAKEAVVKLIDWDVYARRWWKKMQTSSGTFVSSQNPHRLVKLLRLGMVLNVNEDALYRSICRRLAKGDALARIYDHEITRTILAWSRQEREFIQDEIVLLKLYLRRTRKYNVRTELDRDTLVQVLKAIQKLLKVVSRFQIMTDDDDVTKELRVTYYTQAAEFFKATESTEDSCPTSPSEAYLLWQVSRDLSLNPEDALRTNIMKRLEANSRYLIQKATRPELALLSDVFLLSAKFKTTQIVRRIGQVLEHDPAVVSGEVHPWIISSALRYAVLAIPKTETTRDRDATGSHGLLELFRRPPVNDRSNDLLLVQPFQKVLLDLLQRFRSPFAYFSALGEHLLTVNMSVLDISTALYAYGKASFVKDMGVFDHLTTQMTDRIRKKDEAVTLRQVAQSVWACGKMCGFENADEDEMQENVHEFPFERAALEMARYLGIHSPDLTSRDVTQSLWALGMLQISDPDVTRPLVRRAQDLAQELNTQEVANILLALSRIKSEEFKAIFDLTRHFTTADKLTVTRPSTQEAANIIYSLGRLNIRDEEVFKYLSSILMENIEQTSAQAIANVLWSHRVVYIPPPRELLDRWTIKKLGLVSVQPRFELEED